VRNRALIAVLWRSGLRISEALALELRDVDLLLPTRRFYFLHVVLDKYTYAT